MARVMIMTHPLIQHKIGYIRRKDTGGWGNCNADVL